MKIIVTTHPFGEKNQAREMLRDFDVSYNLISKKYTLTQHQEVLQKERPDIIIAGTEKYDAEVLDLCPNLKLISRVGVGLDSVDLGECKKRNIIITYTPDGPANAVAELTICQMLNALRNVQYVSKTWNRYIGKDIKDCVVGIIGCGRIGRLVVQKLQGLSPRQILVNDLVEARAKDLMGCEYVPIMELLKKSDIVTVHIPLVEPGLSPSYDNHNFIDKQELDLMKENSIIINTARGGIINESTLYDWLVKNKDAKAVVDTFENEPYTGNLLELDNAFLTPHLGSCTESSRYVMEVGAIEEVLRYINNQELKNRVV